MIGPGGDSEARCRAGHSTHASSPRNDSIGSAGVPVDVISRAARTARSPFASSWHHPASSNSTSDSAVFSAHASCVTAALYRSRNRVAVRVAVPKVRSSPCTAYGHE